MASNHIPPTDLAALDYRDAGALIQVLTDEADANDEGAGTVDATDDEAAQFVAWTKQQQEMKSDG